MKATQALIIALAAALAAGKAQSHEVTARAALGEKIEVADGIVVEPQSVIEDSRCPMEARCVWAGQVRLQVRVTLGEGSELRELTLGKPEQVADGQLTLQGVMPPRSTLFKFVDIDTKQQQLGVYLQDQIKMDRWTLSLTGRHDWASTENTKPHNPNMPAHARRDVAPVGSSKCGSRCASTTSRQALDCRTRLRCHHHNAGTSSSAQ